MVAEEPSAASEPLGEPARTADEVTVRPMPPT